MTSAGFELLLVATCLALAWRSARANNDCLFAGFLWVALAALAGAFRFAGVSQVVPAHDWLTRVSQGPGTLLMALGVLSATLGPWATRWWGVSVSVVGAAGVVLFSQSEHLRPSLLLLGSTLLIALFVRIVQAVRTRQSRRALLAASSIALLLLIAFGMHLIPLPDRSIIARVDLLHILLVAAYACLWYSVKPENQ
jgi:hypothetical protein